MITPDHEQEIYELHKHAALLEIDAATIRLETAKKEAASAERTLAMADLVATSMLQREQQG